jgi:hypothetical protein
MVGSTFLIICGSAVMVVVAVAFFYFWQEREK